MWLWQCWGIFGLGVPEGFSQVKSFCGCGSSGEWLDSMYLKVFPSLKLSVAVAVLENFWTRCSRGFFPVLNFSLAVPGSGPAPLGWSIPGASREHCSTADAATWPWSRRKHVRKIVVIERKVVKPRCSWDLEPGEVIVAEFLEIMCSSGTHSSQSGSIICFSLLP